MLQQPMQIKADVEGLLQGWKIPVLALGL